MSTPLKWMRLKVSAIHRAWCSLAGFDHDLLWTILNWVTCPFLVDCTRLIRAASENLLIASHLCRWTGDRALLHPGKLWYLSIAWLVNGVSPGGGSEFRPNTFRCSRSCLCSAHLHFSWTCRSWKPWEPTSVSANDVTPWGGNLFQSQAEPSSTCSPSLDPATKYTVLKIFRTVSPEICMSPCCWVSHNYRHVFAQARTQNTLP